MDEPDQNLEDLAGRDLGVHWDTPRLLTTYYVASTRAKADETRRLLNRLEKEASEKGVTVLPPRPPFPLEHDVGAQLDYAGAGSAGGHLAETRRLQTQAIRVAAEVEGRMIGRIQQLSLDSEVKLLSNRDALVHRQIESRTIGVIVSNLENPFFLDIYKTVESDAHERGYEVLMANTDYRSEQLLSSIRLMIGRRVAGLAAIVSEMAPAIIQELAESRLPVVFYDVGTPRQNITKIRVNYRRGIEKVISYLHSLDHRRLGFVGHDATLCPINERMEAVSDAVAQNPVLELRTAAADDTLEGGRQAMRALLDSGFGPTAIVCVNDVMAVGALRELRERGVRVPEDMSVTGFDNIRLSEFCFPALTTVHIPRDRIGHIICDCLIPKQGAAAQKDHEIVIDPEFILRESTGRVPGMGLPAKR